MLDDVDIRDKSKYRMVLDIFNKIYLDGEKKGNFSSFINHSCDPNSVLKSVSCFLHIYFKYI